MDTATVNFIYSIYRQMWQPGGTPDCSLVEFSQQFDDFCYAFGDEAQARRIITDLVKESAHQPCQLSWIGQELQFEIAVRKAGSRKKAALSCLEYAGGSVSDHDLDLYNQRMSRTV